MEHTETLVLDALSAVLKDVLLDEGEVSLIGSDWVGKIVFVELLFWVTDEGSDCTNTGRTLQVLGLDLVVQGVGNLLKFRAADVSQDAV